MNTTRREFLQTAGLGMCAAGAGLLQAGPSTAETATPQKPFLFAQITDIHVGDSEVTAQDALHNLHWALDEIAGLAPRPSLILASGDEVNRGTAAELEVYAKAVRGSAVPIYALPTNHDLAGEKDTRAFERLVGPVRQRVKAGGLTFLLWNDTQRATDGSGKWNAMLNPDQRQWMEKSLGESGRQPVVIVQHTPPLAHGATYHDRWRDSNADELLGLLARHRVLAMVTGHWHRNGEWTERGVRVINTGPLCGWQYNGVPPYHWFPLRPGYRLFSWDGQTLRSFWRDGAYRRDAAPSSQVTVTHIGGVHVGGPRPQVRPMLVSGPAALAVSAYTAGGAIGEVEWSISQGDWRPMQRKADGLWSEWEATLDPAEARAIGSHVLVVRARTNKVVAYDALPVEFAEFECSTSPSFAVAGRETVYELFYPPK
jgi:3',5'-cyclic AMP phosphodiesterase CpdA